MKEKQLIFIASQPRSGSTYLQNLLSNNNEVNTCSEPWIQLNFANLIKPELITGAFDNVLAVSAFEDYLSKFQQLDFKQLKKEFLISLYEPLANGYRFVIDKTPRYWEILNELIELFPKSRFIVIKRDPIDVATSIIKTWQVETLERLNYYYRDLLIAPQAIQDFCEKNVSNKNVNCLRYEDLINDTSGVVKDLFKWLDIEYRHSVLDTSNNVKFKGKYGDPFQNSDKDIHEIKIAFKHLNLAPLFESFLKGYRSYLGSDFLEKYGKYDAVGAEKTTVFDEFRALNASKEELKKQIRDMKQLVDVQIQQNQVLDTELNLIKNSKDYKWGRLFLSPFRFFKQKFKLI